VPVPHWLPGRVQQRRRFWNGPSVLSVSLLRQRPRLQTGAFEAVCETFPLDASALVPLRVRRGAFLLPI
jgi:hypothetical protein